MRWLICLLLSLLPPVLLFSALMSAPAGTPVGGGRHGVTIAVSTSSAPAAPLAGRAQVERSSSSVQPVATAQLTDIVQTSDAVSLQGAMPQTETMPQAASAQSAERIVPTAPVMLPVAAARQVEAAEPAEPREPWQPLDSLPQDVGNERVMPAISEADGDAYLPASQLTERPQVLRDIVSDWTQPPMTQPVTGVLMINEFGDVDRVVLTDATLTPVQQDALRSQLAGARFAPGKLYGRPVKTALRIEVRLH